MPSSKQHRTTNNKDTTQREIYKKKEEKGTCWGNFPARKRRKTFKETKRKEQVEKSSKYTAANTVSQKNIPRKEN